MAHMERSEDNKRKLVFSHHVGSENQAIPSLGLGGSIFIH